MTKAVEDRERVVVRFAGDSGDGMQLAGSRFTDATAVLGNDLATLPNFPAEIRAPAGTLAGVSAFQIHFASRDILTPGDTPNVLVAMNPAALKANLAELGGGATIIANEDAFSKRNLEKAGYEANPLEDGSMSAYRVHRIPMTTLTTRAVEAIEGASTRDAGRAKNLFALGVLSWLYGRPTEVTERWIEQKFASKPAVAQANLAAFKAGWSFGETTELLDVQYRVPRATDVPPGTYRNVNGTKALSLGLIAASVRSRPAAAARQLSDHAGLRAPARALAPGALRRRDDPGRGRDRGGGHGAGRRVRRADRGDRDERARDGPEGRDDRPGGRAGAADGRGRRPARRPVDRDADEDRAVRSFDGGARSPRRVAAAGDRAQHAGRLLRRGFEAVRIAIRYRTPVILLSDTFLASSSEPWRIPSVEDLPEIDPDFAVADGEEFQPYVRDERLARPWALPGTPGPPAPDRRPGEGRRHRQHLLRRRPTTPG